MSEEKQLEPADQADSQDGAARLVPVAESIKYRRRAQQAEGRLNELEQKLEDVRAQSEKRNEELAAAEAQRDEANHALLVAENRLAAQRAMSEAGVVDLETASMLLSGKLDFGGELEAGAITQSVEQLLLDKPFLRGGPASALPPGTASPKAPQSTPTARLAEAAQRAVQTGSRKEVADYLRLRRQVALSRERAAGL